MTTGSGNTRVTTTPPGAASGQAPAHAGRLGRALKWGAIGAGSVAVLGFLVAPPILRHYGERILSEQLARPVTIERVRLNPFALSLTVQGLSIQEPDGASEALAFDTLYANLEAESLFRLAPVLREARLEGPRIQLTRFADGRLNWSDLLERPSAPPEPDGEPVRFSVNNIQLIGGRIVVDDQQVGERHEIADIDIGLPFLSNLPSRVDSFVEPRLSARVNEHALSLSGRTRPFNDDRETVLDVTLDALDIRPFMAYLPFEAGFKVNDGALSTQLEVGFSQPADAVPRVSLRGTAALARLNVTTLDDQPILDLTALEVALADAEPLRNQWHVASVTATSPQVAVARLADGRFSFESLLKPLPPPPAAPAPLAGAETPTPDGVPADEVAAAERTDAEPTSATGPDNATAGADPATVAGQDGTGEPATEDKAASATPAPAEPLRFRVDRIEVADGALHFSDHSNATPFETRVHGIALAVNGLGNAPDALAEATLRFATDADERVQLHNRLRLVPFATEGRIEASGVSAVRYRPYYDAFLPKGEVRDGRVDVALDYRVGPALPAAPVAPASVAESSGLAETEAAAEATEATKAAEAADAAEAPADPQTAAATVAEAAPAATVSSVATAGRPVVARLPAATAADGASDAMPEVVARLESLVLRDVAVALKGQKQPAITLARLSVSEVAVDPARRSVEIGQIESSKLAVRAVRDRQGRIDLLALADGPAAASGKGGGKGSAKAPVPTPAKGGKRKPAAEDAPWSVALNELMLGDWSLRFEDRSAERPVVMQADQIQVVVRDWRNAPKTVSPVNVKARINTRGSVALNGKLGLAPLKGDFKVDLRRVDLLPLQPYVEKQVNIAISRGNLSTQGSLVFDLTRADDIKGRFRGSARIDNFASVDKRSASDFVRWDSFKFDGVDVQASPFSLAIDNVALDDFYTRLILDEEGRLNLREVRPGDEGAEVAEGGNAADAGATGTQAAAAAGEGADAASSEASAGAEAVATLPPAEPPPPIRIGKIALSKGNIAFSDRFVRPNYDVNLTGMAGEVVGLSSVAAESGAGGTANTPAAGTAETAATSGTVATLALQGKIDNSAPVDIRGTLDPFSENRDLDITATVTDFDLPGISTYAGKYVGYGIAKGKLSAELNYKIENRQLVAGNRIFLDQLTFGDKVDSPDALNLPVQLAVSLLKNGRGEIDLHLPVTGTLDDPQFSIGGLVMKAIFNLLTKAITAPFALLGSMFGDGEELSHLDFTAGRAGFDDEARAKLDNLAQALNDRPALKLDITGQAVPAADVAGLREALLEQRIKALKLKALIKKDEEAPSLDDIALTPEEYADLLEAVYKDADFKRPRNAVGMLQSLPQEEMKALLLQHTEVSDDQLRQLAQQRAQGVREYLLEQGKVPSERVFVLAPVVSDTAKDGEAEPQAVFSLR